MSGSSSTLGVYTGVRGNLHAISCTDEPFNAEFVYLDLTGGTTYYFMVAGASDNGLVDELIFELERVPPPPPPLQVSVKIAPQAYVLLRSGAARLTVTMTCSREAWISIGGELSQRLGRRMISGPVGGWVYCTDKLTTTVLVSSTRGRFVPLTARAAVNISSYDPLLGEVVSANANRVLLLRPTLR
jgi:hypothetical protein